MKRLICLIVTIGISYFAFADSVNPTSQVDEYKKLLNHFNIYATDIHKIDSLFNSVYTNGEKIVSQINEQSNQIQKLTEQNDSLKSKIDTIYNEIASPLNCKMLVNYPLTIKYDSVVVNYSIRTLQRYKIVDAQKDKTEFYKNKMKVLQNYKQYNNEIYNLVRKIKDSYVRYNQPYSEQSLESDFKTTDYYKECYNKGYNIKYIDTKITLIRTFIQEHRLTNGNLESVLSDLK